MPPAPPACLPSSTTAWVNPTFHLLLFCGSGSVFAPGVCLPYRGQQRTTGARPPLTPRLFYLPCPVALPAPSFTVFTYKMYLSVVCHILTDPPPRILLTHHPFPRTNMPLRRENGLRARPHCAFTRWPGSPTTWYFLHAPAFSHLSQLDGWRTLPVAPTTPPTCPLLTGWT